MKELCQSAPRRTRARGRPCANESAARIELLLDIAAEVFTECGYKEASVNEIARRAGASKQTLYLRFPSKAKFFEAVLRRETESAHQVFSDILRPDQPVSKVLEEFGKEAIRLITPERSQRLIRTISGAVEAFPSLAKELWQLIYNDGIRTLEDYLAGQSQVGVLGQIDPEIAATTFLGLTMGTYFLPAQLGVEQASLKDRRASVKEAVRVFLCAYSAV